MKLNLKILVKRVLFFLLFAASAQLSIAQNLIQNGNLEDTTSKVLGLNFASYWNSPTAASPDYFSEHHNNTLGNQFAIPKNFAGSQNPKSGKSILGFLVITSRIPPYREYVQNKLRFKLEKDSNYCFQMFISLADSYNWATKNSIGVFFTEFEVDADTLGELTEVPQLVLDSNYIVDKNGWILLEGIYKAKGGEEYIVIGNFNSYANTDTLNLNNGVNDPDFDGAYYYIDDIFLGNCDSLPLDTSIGLVENVLKRQINVYPNPTKNELFIHYQGKEKLQVRLFDLMGKEVSFASTSASLKETNEMLLSVAHLPKGLYFLEIVAGENRISRKIIKQ